MDEFLNMKIAVDFDGTIVEHDYPAIGKEKLFAFQTLRELQKQGALLILWTYRSGKELNEAVEYCKKNGVEFYAVNKNYPEEIFDETMMSRKIDADIYIDDKNIGGFMGWSGVWETLFPYENREQEFQKKSSSLGSILKRIRGNCFLAALLVLFSIPLTSCIGNTRSVVDGASLPNTDSSINTVAEARLFTIKLPENEKNIKLGDEVLVELDVDKQIPDSIIGVYDGKRVFAITSEPWSATVSTDVVSKTGRKNLKITAYKEGKAKTSATRVLNVFSDKIPDIHGFIVKNVYPHDRTAFTQGLFYEGGVLYEGTGQETHSNLREVELSTGKVNRQHNLESNLFGEGITLYNNLIYQVTWTSKVGFVYEKDTFKQLKKIYYQTEAWGLTTVDDKIVMSDGTNVIYFFDPNTFTVVSKIEVCDNEKQVTQLNELEYIEGEIWANVWLTDRIARIDPVSGKVNGYVVLSGLMTDKDVNTDEDVLNGIAYDRENKRIFVTGKNWPKLFEITLKNQ